MGHPNFRDVCRTKNDRECKRGKNWAYQVTIDFRELQNVEPCLATLLLKTLLPQQTHKLPAPTTQQSTPVL